MSKDKNQKQTFLLLVTIAAFVMSEHRFRIVNIGIPSTKALKGFSSTQAFPCPKEKS